MTKEELGAALDIKKKLTRLENRLADLEATGGVRTSLQSGGGGGGKSGDAAVIAAELSNEIAELRKKLEIEQEIVRRALDKVAFDDMERKIMMLRYVYCKPWGYIKKVLGYADRQTYRIHSEAKKMAVDGS